MKVSNMKRQKGFTITELMLVLGVAAVIIAAAFMGYKTLSSNNTDNQNMSATINLVVAVKNKWQGVGSYAAITSAGVNTAGLVSKPLTWDGTNINNAYNKTIVFVGVANNFVGQISLPPANCLEMVGALDGAAYRIDVDTAGVAPGATEDAVKTVKSATTGTIDPVKSNTQCGGATAVITAFVK